MSANSQLTAHADDRSSVRRAEAANITSVFKIAYAGELDDIKAIPATELLQVKLDIDDLITTGLGIVPKLRAFRDDASRLPGYDIVNFDRFEQRLLALREAQTQYDNACEPPDDLEPLAQRAYVIRDILRAEVDVAVLHGLINPDSIKAVSGMRGYKIVASDLLALNGALIEAWPRIEGRGFLTRTLLEEAEALAAKLLHAVGQREQAPAAIASTADLRARAYTLVLRTHDQVQRAITYLRWGKDAEEIVPSLFAGRSRRRSPEPQQPAGPATPATPAPLVPTPTPTHPMGTNPGGSPFIP